MKRWRWAAASRIGTSHLKSGTRKQDAFSVKLLSENRLCAIVADGAGSASHGGQGASLVCRTLMSAFQKQFEMHDELPNEHTLSEWIDHIRDNLSAIAERRDLGKRDFAATMVLLVTCKDRLLAAQIGDSAMVGRRDGRWEAICWPENGEFVSSTFFITDDVEARLRTAYLPLEYDAFALFSDGIDDVALEHLQLQPHARFFDPMIKPVDEASERGNVRQLSVALARYLDSPALCERTDDDKTLVLLSSV